MFGLGKAISYLEEIGGIETIYQRICRLTQILMDELERIPGITIYGPTDAYQRAGIVTFNKKGLTHKEMAAYLNEHNIGIMGHHFHCPGVMDLYNIQGVVRLSVHYWNTEDEIEAVINKIRNMDG